MICVGFLVHIAYIFARRNGDYKLKIIVLQDICHFSEFLTKMLASKENLFPKENEKVLRKIFV